MKKIVFFLALVLAIAIMPGYKQSGSNETSEKNGKAAPQKDLKSISRTSESKTTTFKESQASKIASDEKPKILLLLTNDTGKKTWSPSLWWSYQHAKTVQPGC